MTWIASSGSRRTIDNGERRFENGRKRKVVVDATVLDFTVDGGEAAGDGGGRETAGDEATVRYERWRHCKLVSATVRERK